jgi:hypothetical protein
LYGYNLGELTDSVAGSSLVGDDTKKCAGCGSSQIKKNGMSRGRQRYQCKCCKQTFYRYQKREPIDKMYHEYAHGRQTLSQLSQLYKISERSLRSKFDNHEPVKGIINPIMEPVHIFLDATYFGRRFGVLVFRTNGKNVYWKIIQTESKETMITALNELDQICVGGYLGFTIDGKPGIRKIIADRYRVPVYMCLFHQQQIIRRYTTRNPKTICGQHVRQFSLSLSWRHQFSAQTSFQVLLAIHRPFLNERNENNRFMHRRLRSAVRSLSNNLGFLRLIPSCPLRTTNSCEGAFSHWKNKVRIHRRLRFDRKIKMINFLLAYDSYSIK